MATSRFATNDSNALGPVFQGGTATPVLINGNAAYLNKPALEEDAAQPMARVLTPDRYLPWKTSNAPPSGADALKLDIDLGADRAIKAISFHGIRCLSVPEGLVPRPFTVHVAYRTAAQTYDGAGLFTDFAGGASVGFGAGPTIGLNRDAVIEDSVPRTMRYVRCLWGDAVNSPFSLGRLFVGATPPQDVGRLYWPNSSDDVVLPAIVSDTMGVTFTGDTQRRFNIILANIDAATLAALISLRHTRQSFIYYRHDGTVHECILVGLQSTVAHLFAAADSYAWTLNVMALS